MHFSSFSSWQQLALCRMVSTAQQSSYQLNQAWNFKAERKNESQEVFNCFCSSLFTNCVNFTPVLLIPPPPLRDPSRRPSLTTWRTPPCSKTFSTLWTSPLVKIPICHQSTMPPTPATPIFHQSMPPTFPQSISTAQNWAISYHGRLVPLDSCNLFPTNCGWDEILPILAKYFEKNIFTLFKVNYWYLNIYVLWMNTILNIVLPIILLVVLNILVSIVCAEKKLFSSIRIMSKMVQVWSQRHFYISSLDLEHKNSALLWLVLKFIIVRK